MHSKSPHERRRHATHIAAGVVVLLFIGWLATLGARFAYPAGGSAPAASTAAVANTLESQ